MDPFMRAMVLLGTGFFAVNMATYVLFAVDKHQARTAGWRVSERTLLVMALLGGSPGAKLAQARFRHKTRKQPFRGQLNFVCGLHMAMVAALAWPAPRAVALTVFDSLVAAFAAAEAEPHLLPQRFGPGS